MPNLHWEKIVYTTYEKGPSCALDLHDLWDGDQCEAAKLQLGTTSPDQLAEDQLRFQPDDEFPQGLRRGGQTWLCWEETSATNWCGREGGLQPGAEARLFPVYLSGTYQILASYLLGTYQVLTRYILIRYSWSTYPVYLSGFCQRKSWSSSYCLVCLPLQSTLWPGQIHQLAFQVDWSRYLRQVTKIFTKEPFHQTRDRTGCVCTQIWKCGKCNFFAGAEISLAEKLRT